MLRKLIIIITTIAALSLLIFYVKTSINAWEKNNDNGTFTVEKWNEDILKRESMANDLINQHLLIGKTHQEVIALLGNDGIVLNDNDIIQYIIGANYIDDKVMDIMLDDTGHVTKAIIGGDDA